MQNLSVSDLMSLDAGFHTARRDKDDSGSESERPYIQGIRQDTSIDHSSQVLQNRTEIEQAFGNKW